MPKKKTKKKVSTPSSRMKAARKGEALVRRKVRASKGSDAPKAKAPEIKEVPPMYALDRRKNMAHVVVKPELLATQAADDQRLACKNRRAKIDSFSFGAPSGLPICPACTKALAEPGVEAHDGTPDLDALSVGDRIRIALDVFKVTGVNVGKDGRVVELQRPSDPKVPYTFTRSVPKTGGTFVLTSPQLLPQFVSAWHKVDALDLIPLSRHKGQRAVGTRMTDRYDWAVLEAMKGIPEGTLAAWQVSSEPLHSLGSAELARRKAKART